MAHDNHFNDWAQAAVVRADARLQRELSGAQKALIEALTEGDHSRSDSALAELRLAIRAGGLPETQRDAALSAVESLAATLHDSHRIHDDTRVAA